MSLALNSVQDQDTALMVAAKDGSVGIVRMLIQHGASMNLTDKVTQCTPMLSVCNSRYVASFPGPAQLSVACSTVL